MVSFGAVASVVGGSRQTLGEPGHERCSSLFRAKRELVTGAARLEHWIVMTAILQVAAIIKEIVSKITAAR
jgi:hypothetical protein